MRTRWAAVCAVAMIVLVAGCSPSSNGDAGDGPHGLDGASVVATPDPSAVSNPVHAFDDPMPTALGPKKVFAHYFPPYPISLDNADPSVDYYTTHYLDPAGEDRIHESYGGFFRDRPLPRAPRVEANWGDLNLQDEVRQAISAGITGFSVDILSAYDGSGFDVASRPAALLSAAAAVDPSFSIMLMPDMTGDLGTLSPSELADQMSIYASSASAFRLDDGRLVVSPFGAETKDPSWWADFESAMANEHGFTVALVPVFVDTSKGLDAYASVSYGMSAWGARNPEFNPVTDDGPQSPVALANKAHELGKIWMAPVAMQDNRPSQSIYDEASNTENLRSMWQIALDTNSEWVQLTTWNDYSEATAFAPSVEHGWSFLDISAYWLYWFRTGSPPPIVRDAVYLTHREQFAGADPVEPAPMTLRTGSTPPTDTVEALTFSTAPSTVVIDVGGKTTSCMVPAGVGVCVAPLAIGAISASVSRGDNQVASVQSPFPVDATPVIQNLDYFGVSSLR